MSKKKMDEQTCNNSGREGASEKRLFALERGLHGTLICENKTKIFEILVGFQEDFRIVRGIDFPIIRGIDFSIVRVIDFRFWYVH
jgi:hypothetical protein